MMKQPPLLGFCLLISAVSAVTAETPSVLNPDLLANGLRGNGAAIQTIREIGPAALKDLRSGGPVETAPPPIQALLDRVAAQKDAVFSGLYWYTDLALAKAQAARENKPILSLRLLGKLSDEFSCANSRYFRAILYSDPQIAELLRSRFILHWESVRPAPLVTIDFGDGRRLKTTVTGNSIHYMLSPNGDVIDAIPGLYQPTVFLQELQNLLTKTKPERAIRTVAVPVSSRITQASFPSAAAAGMRTDSKIVLERPVLKIVSPSLPPAAPIVKFDGRRTISEASIRFMKWKLGAAYDEKRFEQELNSLEMSLARETQTNQNELRPQILQWIASSPKMSLQELNDRVYSELFLTPREDKWLGMRSELAFSALSNDGIELAP